MEGQYMDQRRISKEELKETAAAAKLTRSFRYEDYSTRRVFLRSYPLQWDWSPAHAADEKQQLGQGGTAKNGVDGRDGGVAHDGDDGDEGCGGRWGRQVAVAVVEWGEEKLLLLRRVKKRVALYLLGCHYGRARLPFRSGGSCTAAMLTSR